jgi:hypothetical protein
MAPTLWAGAMRVLAHSSVFSFRLTPHPGCDRTRRTRRTRRRAPRGPRPPLTRHSRSLADGERNRTVGDAAYGGDDCIHSALEVR